MKLRIKHTFMYGDFERVAGTIDSPMVELTMKDGRKLCYLQSELTDKPPFELVWTVFARDGSRKNQAIFIAIICLCFIACIFIVSQSK